eukprot:748851-Amphidinium_carterae.1
MLGSDVALGSVVMTAMYDFDLIKVGAGAAIDKDAVLSGMRMLPVAAQSPSAWTATSFAKVSIASMATVSHGAIVAGAEVAEMGVLAPLSALGQSMRLPARALAVGAPPQ